MSAYPADDTDFEILALLQEDGRRPVSDIAARVTLSATAVKRRIERMELAEIVTGYSATIDYAKLGWPLSAFVELRFEGTTSPGDMDAAVASIPEVSAVYTTAGDQDVIALARARSVDHLRDVIHRLRASGRIVATRTHVILDAHIKHAWGPPGA